jgi:2,7-dihydroxy-5-methyl-1-naphthoate 7-O-methyltransferase
VTQITDRATENREIDETDNVSGPGPDPTAWQRLAPVLDLVTPMAVRVAATLRLADLMTEGPVPVGELAGTSATQS